MFGFLKKFFGMDKETMKEAGVQIEQPAPYKVEPVVQATVEPPKESVVITVVEKKSAKAKRKPVAKMAASEKKKPIEKKPRAKRTKKI